MLNLVFGWKIILQIEKWAKCHLLLKCGLKTSTYDIWFLCALFASNFLFFKVFMGYLWVSLILLDLFLISRSYLLIWVFGRFSCKFWDFWIFIWSIIPNQNWTCDSWQISGQSEFWKRGQSADKRRTVCRSWKMFTRGSVERFQRKKLYSGRSASHRCNRSASDTPMVCPLSRSWTVRQGSADSPPVLKKSTRGGFSSGLMLKLDCGRSAHGLQTVRSCFFQVDPGS